MEPKQTDSIIELNRDVEPYVIQASASRSMFFKAKFGDPYIPLQFVHLSDAHAVLDLWNRMTEYVNHYAEYLSFALHTGDYCGNSQSVYCDFYTDGIPCLRPRLNCVGNHDTYKSKFEVDPIQPKEITRDMLFKQTEAWGVEFMDVPASMTYRKEFPESNVRLLVLDNYYHQTEQLQWLADQLLDARQKGIFVITASHETTAHVHDSFGVSFHTANDYEGLNGRQPTFEIEQEIVRFKELGGIHVCHLAGHHHHDLFGLTDAGVLNVAVPCATNWHHWCDGKRVKGTRTYDCFNVVAVDANLHHLKIVRIGDNCDHFLRPKHALCFDFKNNKVISCF